MSTLLAIILSIFGVTDAPPPEPEILEVSYAAADATETHTIEVREPGVILRITFGISPGGLEVGADDIVPAEAPVVEPPVELPPPPIPPVITLVTPGEDGSHCIVAFDGIEQSVNRQTCIDYGFDPDSWDCTVHGNGLCGPVGDVPDPITVDADPLFPAPVDGPVVIDESGNIGGLQGETWECWIGDGNGGWHEVGVNDASLSDVLAGAGEDGDLLGCTPGPLHPHGG